MKLYTEEQVLRMLEVCRDSDLYEHILTFEDIVKTETPIELPSDEEIENESPYVPKDSHIICFAHQDGFIDGAIWLREKIQGGEL